MNNKNILIIILIIIIVALVASFGTYALMNNNDNDNTNLNKTDNTTIKNITNSDSSSNNPQQVSSNYAPRDGVDYDSSQMTYEEYLNIKNNPNGHYDMAGNYYAPGEGQ